MLDCLILGDSIAVGLGQVMPQCVTEAKSGINSIAYNTVFHNGNRIASVVVISLGTNDSTNVKTGGNLILLRNEIDADVVYWVLPSKSIKSKQREVVLNIAEHHDDRIIDIDKEWLSSDHIHPTGNGYKQIAKLVK